MSEAELFDQLIAAVRQEGAPGPLSDYAAKTVQLLDALNEVSVAIRLPLLDDNIVGMRGSLRAWEVLLETRAEKHDRLFPGRHQRR